jgi:hypothetical protein
MDSNIILQSLIASVVSSAVVSSIVTAYLKNKNDLKKRKVVVYTDFLEQYRKIFPLGDLGLPDENKSEAQNFSGANFISWRKIKQPEILKLERSYYPLVIIGSGDVTMRAYTIMKNIQRAIIFIDKAEYEIAVTHLKNARDLYLELMADMANDIQGFRRYKIKYKSIQT